jgi:hypothetical protein
MITADTDVADFYFPGAETFVIENTGTITGKRLLHLAKLGKSLLVLRYIVYYYDFAPAGLL